MMLMHVKSTMLQNRGCLMITQPVIMGQCEMPQLKAESLCDSDEASMSILDFRTRLL